MKNTIIRALLGLSFAALLSACASTPEATMDFDPAFDFSGVRKIAIQPIHRTVASQAVLSDMQIGRVNDSLTAELQRRGFQVVTDNAEADMLLAWHLVTQDRTDIRTFNTATRYNCWNCRRMGMGTSTQTVVRQYTQGTFIVDMIDPDRLQSVWRSIIESRLQSSPPDPASAEAGARRAEAATAIFAEFPPG